MENLANAFFDSAYTVVCDLTYWKVWILNILKAGSIHPLKCIVMLPNCEHIQTIDAILVLACYQTFQQNDQPLDP